MKISVQRASLEDFHDCFLGADQTTICNILKIEVRVGKYCWEDNIMIF